MTPSRAPLVLLVLVIVAAIAAWSVLQQESASGPVDVVRGRADAPRAPVEVRARGTPVEPVPLAGEAPAPEPVTSVEEVALVTGRVVDARGAPVGDATVRVFESREGFPFRGRVDLAMRATTDAEGTFAVAGLPPGTPLGVEASHPDHAPVVQETFVVARGARDDLGTLRLTDGARLLGRVTDVDGRPLAGVLVSVADRTMDHRRGESSTPSEVDVTGADGLFAIPHLAPRQYEIEVFKDGYARARRVLSLALAGSVDLEQQDFRLEAAAEPLGGLVVDPLGTPIPGATITVVRARGGTSLVLEEAESGPDGAFLFRALPEGLYEVRARAPRHYLADVARLEAGRLDHRLRLEPARAVTGILTSEDGTVPARFEVVAQPQPGSGARLLERDAGRRRYDALPTPGRFTFDGLTFGTWRLEVLAPGFAPTTSHDVVLSTTAPEVEVVIPLRRGGTITGRIAPPVEGAVATLREPDYDPSLPLEATFPTPPSHGLQAATDAEGAFVLEHVPEGAYVLSLTAAGRPALHRDVEVFEGGTTALGELAAPGAARLIGQVLDTDGLGRAAARVQARSGEHFAEVTCDREGRFAFEALPAGDYEVSASPPGLWEALRLQASTRLLLRAGDEAETVLALAERPR